jgi:hypothetical protein
MEKHRKSGLQEPVPGMIPQAFPQKNLSDSISWRILQGGRISAADAVAKAASYQKCDNGRETTIRSRRFRTAGTLYPEAF